MLVLWTPCLPGAEHPLHLARRELPPHLHPLAVPGRHSPAPAGAGRWPTAAPEQRGFVEGRQPLEQRCGLQQLYGEVCTAARARLAFPSRSHCACIPLPVQMPRLRLPRSVSPTLAPVPHCFLSLKLFPAPQVCFFSSMYLNVVNAWFLFYLSQSIQSPAPWEICPLLKNASDFGKEERGRTGLEGKFGRRDGSRERWAEGDGGRK